jgi:hypothetical protein
MNTIGIPELNPNFSENNQYIVAYNFDDFFWNSVNLNNGNTVPEICNNNNISDYCPTKNDSCINFLKETCTNYDNSKKIKQIQTHHSGANSRFADSTSFYNKEILKSMNLGVGIIYLSVMIYINYKNK